MRFKIQLQLDDHSERILPLNYQYALSAAIYKCMSRSDSEYTAWLHDNGFSDSETGGKRMKLFSFSNFRIPKFTIAGDRLTIGCDTITLYLSFLPERSTAAFVKGAFADQIMEVGDRESRVRFRVTDISILPALSEVVPVHEDGLAAGSFQSYSPLCISLKDPQTGKPTYLSPDDPAAALCLLNNLKQKYRFFRGEDYAGDERFVFELLAPPRKKGITIKPFTPQQTKVIGYECRFRLQCAPELLDIAGAGGLGEKGSMGFGFIAVRPV